MGGRVAEWSKCEIMKVEVEVRFLILKVKGLGWCCGEFR